ncbi:hypothetical protein [Streptomyces sp. NPDC005374]|uniref:hypothetical protein n=1 Tax=Streptomyces sp. NPDC005374 TaxID=3364713 RepID=UPI0036B9517D
MRALPPALGIPPGRRGAPEVRHRTRPRGPPPVHVSSALGGFLRTAGLAAVLGHGGVA